MKQKNANRFRFRIEILVEWPKGLLRLIGVAIKTLTNAIADLIWKMASWLPNPWKWQ